MPLLVHSGPHRCKRRQFLAILLSGSETESRLRCEGPQALRNARGSCICFPACYMVCHHLSSFELLSLGCVIICLLPTSAPDVGHCRRTLRPPNTPLNLDIQYRIKGLNTDRIARKRRSCISSTGNWIALVGTGWQHPIVDQDQDANAYGLNEPWNSPPGMRPGRTVAWMQGGDLEMAHEARSEDASWRLQTMIACCGSWTQI